MGVRAIAGACLALLVSSVTFGQSAGGQSPNPKLTFEVASIRPSGPQSVRGWDGGPGSDDPGTYRFGDAQILDLIMVAYHVDPFQISSKFPLEGQSFDLVAKLPEHATRREFRLMLQNLLAERFHLTLHIVSKEFPGYELRTAKKGPKLKESGSGASPPQAPTRRSSPDDGFPDLAPDRPGMATKLSVVGGYELARLKAVREPISALVQSVHDLHIVDKTGLTGRYDFTLEYTRDLPEGATPDEPPIAPHLFTALQQQLGLQLVATKVPYDYLIIDHVDSKPTEN